MQTVKGRAVGEESVIGELVRYRSCGDYFDRRARIALIDADTYDFDMLFEVSQEFMGFVWVGEFDKGIAEMAEELRLVGLFCDDEKRLCEMLDAAAFGVQAVSGAAPAVAAVPVQGELF
jgi:hypothetical protein